jgi:hypothetical protein
MVLEDGMRWLWDARAEADGFRTLGTMVGDLVVHRESCVQEWL